MLYELQEDIKLMKIRQDSIKNQISMLDNRMENIGAVKFDKISVMGRGTPLTIDDMIDKKTKLETELKMIEEHLPLLEKELKGIQEVLNEFNERDMLIYEHSKLKGWTSVKIAIKFGLSSGRVRDIVSTIDKTSNKFKMLFEGCDE